MRATRALAVAVLVSLLAPITAKACWVCEVPESASEAAFQDPVIFVGTVKARSREIVRFTVQENFGVPLGQTVVMNRDGYDCRFRFELGKTYLVYTKVDEKNYLAPATICSRTAEVSAAKDDLRYWHKELGSTK